MNENTGMMEENKNPGTLRLMWRLLRMCMPGQIPLILVGLIVSLGSAGAALLQPWPLKLVVDNVVSNHPLPGPLASVTGIITAHTAITSPRVALLVILCLAVLVIQALVGLFEVLSTYLLVSVGLRMVFKLRCALFNHIQQLSLSFHDATAVGDSLYRVTWDTYCVQELFNSAMIPALTAVFTLGGIAFIMISIDWKVTIAALMIGVPLVFFIRRIDKPMTEFSTRVHERESDISSRVQEALTSIRAVQAYGREEFEGARFRQHANASMRANLRLTVLESGSQAVIDLLLAVGTAAVIGVTAAEALGGQLTVGDVVLLVAYVAMLYQPLQTLASTAVVVQSAAAGAQRVFSVLDASPDVADAGDAIELQGRAKGHIAFEHVSFSYREDLLTLRDVCIEVPAGGTVALVGPSGAGKTTLASLLIRFYDPKAGRITLDGADLRSLTLKSLRRNIALVLQEPVLFSASVRENIEYARPGVTLEEIKEAARAAGAHEFIQALPGGYETEIGERGVTLSGGQRQRLSIARAFLKNAPILILDEPTSALDAETEAQLLEALERLKEGRTTLIIAHRLSTIRSADQIVVLQDGMVVETGTLTELRQGGGPFQRLYDSQFRSVPH
ncbi:MAG TPA: ABC transporter ATP-binding protein [Ktedonobacteraceae bacterium]|jgi:ATP-binding cassette subfamily B protein|nr:ABC transporter ATP-binding protein [Ktedonobacteraceae bacterium]